MLSPFVIFKLIKVWWHYATLLDINTVIFNTLYNHTFIHPSPFAEACLLVSSSLLRSAKDEPPWDAEPRIELGPALQQADALPTETTPHPAEPRRTLLRHAAPY